MLRQLLFVFLVSTGAFCGVSEPDWQYDFNQIKKLVDRTLTCLEYSGTLSPNATTQVALAQGFLVEVYDTVPNLSGERLKIVKNLQSRFSNLIEDSILAYPDDILRYVWRSQYYNQPGDYPFFLGSVNKTGPLERSYESIVQNSLISEKYAECFGQLFILNGNSPVGRKCQFPCEEIMYNDDFDSGISAEQKAWYNGFQAVLNCTNIPRQQIKAREARLCSHILSEVHTMLLNKKTQLFDDTRYYYLGKLAECSAWGFQEFLSRNYIASVIEEIDCNGCVAVTKGNEVSQVLTGQTLTILSTTLRMAIEKDARL